MGSEKLLPNLSDCVWMHFHSHYHLPVPLLLLLALTRTPSQFCWYLNNLNDAFGSGCKLKFTAVSPPLPVWPLFHLTLLNVCSVLGNYPFQCHHASQLDSPSYHIRTPTCTSYHRPISLTFCEQTHHKLSGLIYFQTLGWAVMRVKGGKINKNEKETAITDGENTVK